MKQRFEPAQLTAAFLAILAAALGLAAYLLPGDATSRQALFQLAVGFQGGSLGVLVGHKSGDTMNQAAQKIENKTE